MRHCQLWAPVGMPGWPTGGTHPCNCFGLQPKWRGALPGCAPSSNPSTCQARSTVYHLTPAAACVIRRGQLYLQLGVPKSGPPLQPGSVVTRPTGDVRGNGAYATQLIPAGTHIADYAGEVLSNEEFFSRYPDAVVSSAQRHRQRPHRAG